MDQSAENDCPEWVKRAVTLRDHFDDWTTMRVAEPQPQYGLVQLNVERKGVLISVDVKRADLLAALDACVIPPEEPRCNPVGGVHALWCRDR